MKRIAPLLALIALIAPSLVAAQTPEVIAGLQVIAERQYAADTTGTLDTTQDAVYLASARVYLFDDEASTKPVWETLVAVEVIEDTLGDAAGDTIVRENLDNIGDQAVAISVSVDLQDNQTAVYRMVVAQRGAMIVTVTVIAGSEQTANLADSVATAMIARDPSTAIAKYDGNGGSTGGVWDVFLAKDAPELTGLTAYLDKETRPAGN